MSVTIGVLHIDLEANTAKFSSAMDKVGHLSAKSATDVKKSLEKLALAGAAMVTSIIGATAGIVHHSHEAIIGLGNMAQAVGTNVEMLSTLQYAALRTNVPFEAITTSMGKLAKAAFQAQNGNVQLRDVFARLGVNVVDSNGHLKDTGDLLSEVAPKFAQMADGAGKTALAQLLFGRGGATIIPFLKDWASGQEELTANAKKFGMTLSSDVIEKAQKFDDTIDDLMAVSKGFGYQLTAAAYPALAMFGDKLVEIAVKADIPQLAKSFGQNLTSALQLAGQALDFIVTHVNALKLAFEGLLLLRVANFAVPLIASFSGMGPIVGGLSKFGQSALGITALVKTLKDLGAATKISKDFIGPLAEGMSRASGASLMFSGVLAVLSNPIGLTIGVIAALTAALYAYRDASFEAYGATYTVGDAVKATLVFLQGRASFKQAMDIFKGQRTHKDQGPELDIPHALVRGKPGLEPPDTKLHEKDIFGEEIKKLDLAIATQKAYLAVVGASPAKIMEVEAAQKAEAKILELDTQLYEKYRRHLTEAEKATLRQKIALEDSITALVAYGKEIDGQVQSTELAVLQTRNLANAQLEGDEAIRQTTIDNAILALTYNKTAEALETTAVATGKLRELMAGKSSAELVEGSNKKSYELEQEITGRKIAIQSATQYTDAIRQAQLAVKTLAIDQQIANSKNPEEIASLERQRNLIREVTQLEFDEADAKDAIALRSPLEQYAEEVQALIRMQTALEKGQGQALTYSQSMVLAAKTQDAFNKATDETVNLLLRFGAAKDGVKAFFLDMQKEAKSSAGIIYEALHSAFEKLSDNLTELLTGGKTNFGAMFRDIGKQMVKSTIQKGLQTALGKIGEKLGISMPGTKPDGSSAGMALWVRMADAAGLSDMFKRKGGGEMTEAHDLFSGQKPAAAGKQGGGLMSAIIGALIGAALGKASGGGKGGGGERVTSTISFGGERADGGPVSPDRAYLIGERGPEILMGASGNIASASASQRMLGGGGSTHYYTIDARGTDPVLTEQRTREAIIAAHNSAISNSVQVNNERMMRTPQRR